MTPRPTAEEARLRYSKAHWARNGDRKRALESYLELGARRYNQTKLRLLSELAGDLRGKAVLDFGGGAGIFAIPCAKAGAEVVIVDAEANALETARFYAEQEGVGARIRTETSVAPPAWLRESRFDVVLAKDLLEHVPEDQELLRELARTQRPGDILLISTQNRWSLNFLLEGAYQRYWSGNRDWRGWDQTHVRFYSPASLRRKLRRAGYRPDRWASVYLVPYGLAGLFLPGKRDFQMPSLHGLDVTLGKWFPFNRLGWNILVRAVRT